MRSPYTVLNHIQTPPFLDQTVGMLPKHRDFEKEHSGAGGGGVDCFSPHPLLARWKNPRGGESLVINTPAPEGRFVDSFQKGRGFCSPGMEHGGVSM